ncbi:MAG: SDR family NAD(P)-dependent oxidoreductase [Actinomycetota bacterium]
MKLHGSVGILTGASRGIGVYIAEHLAKKGVSLALTARSAGDLKETAERVLALGVDAVVVPADITARADLENLVKRANAELGPVDLLVNNAGIEHIEHYVQFAEIDPDEIELIMTTNIVAAQLLSRLVLPGMIERGRGHIVNISSAAGKTAVPYNTVYSSSKHALVGFSWSLREEIKSHGVGVSVVCPGFVADTGMFASWAHDQDAPRVAGTVPPEKVADAVIKAVESDRAEIIVSGGLGVVVDIFHAISPELTTGIARRAGLYDFLAKQATGRK